MRPTERGMGDLEVRVRTLPGCLNGEDRIFLSTVVKVGEREWSGPIRVTKEECDADLAALRAALRAVPDSQPFDIEACARELAEAEMYEGAYATRRQAHARIAAILSRHNRVPDSQNDLSNGQQDG